jgi:hypothetical protein
MRRRWVFIAAAVVVLIAGLIVAIRVGAGHRDQAAKPDGPPVRLHATAEQWRENEVKREIAVALHNDGDVPVWVSRVDLVLPSFEGETGVDTNTLLPAGGLRVDIPVKFGTGSCLPAAAPSYAVVVARPEGATRWQRVTVAFPDPNPLLNQLLAIDCATQRVEQSVTLKFGRWRDLGKAGVQGSLVVDRTAAATGDVAIPEVDGNVLYDFTFTKASTKQALTKKDSPLATVTAAAPHAEVPFVAEPQRCDLHAIAETKKPFEFPVWVTLGGGKPLATTVPVDDDDRKALDTMLRRNCGLPPA